MPEAELVLEGIDRNADGPDAVPDAPRPKTAAARPDHGGVIADAAARRACALNYRATVKAVYAAAELETPARRPGDNPPRPGGRSWPKGIQNGMCLRPTRRRASTSRASIPRAGSMPFTPAGTAGCARTTAVSFDENQMSYSDAIYFTPDGKVMRNDHQ